MCPVDIITDIRFMEGLRGVEASGLNSEETQTKVEKGADDTRPRSGDLETPLIENSHAGNIPAIGRPSGSQQMTGGLMGRRLLHEDNIQAQELLTLGVRAYEQFGRTGHIEDIDKAIEYWGIAVALLRGSQGGWWNLLSNLGCAYESRFRRLGKVSDLKNAIESGAEAVSLAPNGHPDKPAFLNNLGNSYQTRFELLGELSDLNKGIEFKVQAVSLTPDGHPSKPRYINNLGVSYVTRFQRLGELSDLNNAIESKSKAVLLTPNSHPNKPGRLNNLGASCMTRFKRLGELSDIDKAIECQAQAVLLAPDGHPEKLGCLNNLGNSYKARFERLGELSDLNKAIESQDQAVTLAPNDHPDKAACFNNLGASYGARFGRLGKLSDLNKAIESQVQAVSLTPNGHPDKPVRLNNLGISYETRFGRLGELSDLNNAIECQARAVSITPDGHPDKPQYFNNLGNSHETRFQRLGELSDLNKAIESQDQAIALIPNGHPDRASYFNNLGASYAARFGRLGKPSDLNKAIESHAKADLLAPDNHPDRPAYLNNLGAAHQTRFRCLGELTDLNMAIESQVQAVSLTPDSHPDKPAYLNNLGTSYHSRFGCLCEVSDLNKSIESGAQAVLLTPDGHPNKPRYLKSLGTSYETRFGYLSELSDLQSAGSAFEKASQSPTGAPSVRFSACRRWAKLCLHDAMPSPLPAYQHAMSLIPQLVWIGTTIDRRYELVAEVSRFATEAAAHAISTGAYTLALEWLEAGRSIVWGQIAQLRTPFDDLARHNSKLAEDLVSVGRRLESAGSRSSLSPPSGTGKPDVDQVVSTHIQLALRWDGLLKEVRLMPGFEDFLCSPTADRLLSAFKAHPIAIINLHESRCDALVIRPEINIVSHVALTEFCSNDAVLARRHVLSQARGRKPGPRLNPLGSLHSPLESVWSGVIKPVLDFLGYTRKLPFDQLPHLTWCTAGLLSFLPLHAAGGQDELQSSTFDLVISSYTPTLSALLSSQSADPNSNCGILAVGQENTPGLTNLPCTTQELAVIGDHAQSEYYLQLEDDEATVEQVLDAMDQFSWVHMACHGSQDADDPTKSAFHLYDGNLTLAAITKRSFTNKGLAFLSACQTATGDEKMPDEAVHLAAGMLMAGYPSVIGTMWSIADEDGPEVANLVYAELLKDGKMDHTNSARALHQAVGHLRQKVGERDIARWAPFIHIGS